MPGSPTEEIARMLETEPQDRQSDQHEPESAGQGAGQEGGQRRGLLRRGRRSVTRPAGPPEFKSGAPADEGSAGQQPQPAGPPSGSVPAVPTVPGAQQARPAQAARGGGQSSGATPQPVPVPAFQPPVLVFQPPELTDRPTAEPSRPRVAASTATAGEQAPAEGHEGTARRRRRGGRGRGKGSGGDSGAAQGAGQAEAGQEDDTEPGPAAGKRTSGQEAAGGGRQETARAAAGAGAGGREAAEDTADGEESAGTGSSSRRRRRRRQRNGSAPAGGEIPSPDEPADTVVHIREPRSAAEPDDVRAVKGSTRLEAKRQRRREGRDTGRRRPPIISESEFLARREAVERVMAVRQQGDRTQIAVLEDGVLVEHYVDKASHQSYVGNVYLGKVQNVLPSMEAAFVDIGKGRNAVLYAGEVNFDASGLEGVAKRIESALKSGQSIMVQVTKDPIGHKGARLTSQVSLPGRYLVYVPGASMTGISRKLPDTERTRLKQILKKVAPEEGGIIVRTAAEGASEEELEHDVTRLVAQWQAIERKAKTASAPDLLYGEPDLTIRVVRDIFNEDFTRLVIASDSEWDLVDEYVRYVAPTLSDRMERWSEDKDLFAAYRIDEQLTKALDRKVWLPSGGSLVIDTTEAMTVIDVNTGKFTGQGGNLEQTVTRNNLEAAEEIVRQLRLRDIGGIIVIDFIDMVLESNRDLVLRRLIECLARDRTKHQVAEVTSLGLVQMTRKRVGSGLLAAFSVQCEHCNGRGLLVSTELTELPQPHGRNGQGAPKPGPARSRSARTKAIAQVAAKTIDTGAAASSAVAVEEEAAPVQVEPVQVEPERAEPVRAEPVRAEPAAAALTGPDAEPVAAIDAAAAARKRPRRSAHREAGPPSAVTVPATDGAGTQSPAAASSDGQPAEFAASESAASESAASESAASEAAASKAAAPEVAAPEAAASAAPESAAPVSAGRSAKSASAATSTEAPAAAETAGAASSAQAAAASAGTTGSAGTAQGPETAERAEIAASAGDGASEPETVDTAADPAPGD
ncbi:MAG TPA: Rne/Rng family ribonuclease [Streptosporangiaceae bacterium]